MPLYNYKCKRCGETREVLRNFKDYQVPPEPEGCLIERSEDQDENTNSSLHKWERYITGDLTITKGDSWGGGKGNW